jgi:hypothetical protein
VVYELWAIYQYYFINKSESMNFGFKNQTIDFQIQIDKLNPKMSGFSKSHHFSVPQGKLCPDF